MGYFDRGSVTYRQGLKKEDYPVGYIFKDHVHKHWDVPAQEYDNMIVTENGIMPMACLFIDRYPHLYIVDTHGYSNGSVHVWMRRVHKWGEGYTWDGLAGDGEPLRESTIKEDNPLLHDKLSAMEDLAKRASEPGYFLCGDCYTPKKDKAGMNFNAAYCQECYNRGGEAKKRVDEARRPNYYD